MRRRYRCVRLQRGSESAAETVHGEMFYGDVGVAGEGEGEVCGEGEGVVGEGGGVGEGELGDGGGGGGGEWWVGGRVELMKVRSCEICGTLCAGESVR